jgi:uncharacterized UBP type Zn finger protein
MLLGKILYRLSNSFSQQFKPSDFQENIDMADLPLEREFTYDSPSEFEKATEFYQELVQRRRILRKVVKHSSAYLTDEKFKQIQQKIVQISRVIIKIKKEMREGKEAFEKKSGDSTEDCINLQKVIENTEQVLGTQQCEILERLEKKNFPKGIRNIGNSCYLNASLQVLMANPYFKARILSEDYPVYHQHVDAGNRVGQIDRARATMVMDALRNFVRTNETENLRDALFLANVIDDKRSQQDSGSVIGYILDVIGYSMQQQMIKEAGDHRKEEFTPFQLLQIHFASESSLQEMVDHLAIPTINGNDENPWRINEDEVVTEWIETQKINGEPPEYLQIQLNGKTDERVEVGDYSVDLTNLFGQEAKYRIVSAVIHEGTQHFGHYYSVVEKDHCWFKCNDSRTTVANNPERELEKGYIYFLEKVSE